MTKLLVALVLALGFVRVLDGGSTAAAVLYALGALAFTGLVDLGGAVARKVRGAVAPKGGRA